MGFLRVKALFQITLLLMSVFAFSSAFASPVLAEEEQQACCEKTVSGEYCLYTGVSQCDPSFNSAPTTCEQTSFCQPVCCIDTFEGDCFKNVPTSLCYNTANMTLDARDPTCQINPVCQVGCCQIGNQCFLGTERECSVDPTLPSSFDPSITSEVACINQCRAVEEGCCVDPESGCSYTSRAACPVADISDPSSGTGFFTDTFCSTPGLACSCTPHARIGCVPGEDDVYWFDSCGNREEIAEDCDYGQGTLCRETEGVASCESVNCLDTADFPSNVHDSQLGSFRKNGESWCVYESGVGAYLDRPGSRHYRHLCVNGHELVEPCRDFRQEVCVQSTVDIHTSTGVETFTESNCLRNEIYDSVLTEEQTLVPKGQNFWDGENELLCSEGNVDCTVYFVKKDSFSNWECEGNCECMTPAFIDQAASYCKSKGDCGADLTIFEKRSDDGLKIVWSGTSRGDEPDQITERQWKDWGAFGVFTGMKELSEAMSADVQYQQDDATDDVIKHFGPVLLATYVVGSIAAAFTSATLAQTLALEFWTSNAGNIVNGISVLFGGGASSGGAVAASEGAASGAGASTGEAASASSSAGADAAGVASTIGVIIGVALLVYGLATGNYVTSVQGASLAVGCLFGPLGCLVGAIVGVVLSLILGQAKVREKHVQISCLPWQPPTGGEDCEKCDDDPFKECSEYRCRSLGAACTLINAGTKESACISTNPNDVNSPRITPSRESLSHGFTLSETSNGFRINELVPPFTLLSFGVNLDEPGQCKFDTEHTGSYEEMTLIFGSSVYRERQNATLTLLTPGEYAYYLRCTDARGNANTNEYSVQFSVSDEPDRTAPVVEYTSIDNHAAMPYGANETVLVLFLSEPASQCRWSTVDMDFDTMPEENLFACGNDADFDGTPDDPLPPFSDTLPMCAGILKGIDDGVTNQYYIRCQDLAGNVNQQSFDYVLRGTTPLEITGSGPSGTLYANDVRLSVLTSSGADHGVATCTYNGIDFLTTGQSLHEQPLDDLLPGAYSFSVECEDLAGNTDTVDISFQVDVDTYAPLLTLVYVQDNLLHVVTDEPSDCRYSTDDATFAFDQGMVMSGDGMTDHTLSDAAPLYFLKCRDSFANELVATLYV